MHRNWNTDAWRHRQAGLHGVMRRTNKVISQGIKCASSVGPIPGQSEFLGRNAMKRMIRDLQGHCSLRLLLPIPSSTKWRS